MNNIAFFAPLKSPNHTIPSGDRTLARNLIKALGVAGYHVDLASELRLLDRSGDAANQSEIRAQVDAEIPQIIWRGRNSGWKAWITYHTYYKAPDLVGPVVSEALGIPYVLIEATRAKKRLGGPWDGFAQSAEAACDAAQAILYFTKRDAEALESYRLAEQILVHLKPFLALETLPAQSTFSGDVLVAGMMRNGDKLASYQLIAEALALTRSSFSVKIAGDGPARADVEKMMARIENRITFLGALSGEQMAKEYGQARAFLWPGVNEAIGLVYLEAQAAGLTVIAQDRPGMRDVLAPGLYPSVDVGAAGLANRLDRMLDQKPNGSEVRKYIASNHLLSAAARTLKATIDPLIEAQNA